MKKEEFVALGIGEELAEKAAEASANELKGFIPKARFDEVNNAKAQLEKDVAIRDQQIADLKKIDPEKLQEQIDALTQQNADAKAKYEANLKAQKIDAAVTLALTNAKAVNVKAVKALLDLDKADIAEDGTVKGLDEQIKALQDAEDSKMLFQSQTPKLRGFKPGEGRDGTPADGGEPKTMAQAIEMALSADGKE